MFARRHAGVGAVGAHGSGAEGAARRLSGSRADVGVCTRTGREGIDEMAVGDAITVAVRVHPGASREGIALLPDGSLDVRLRARPVEGQANARLVELLAERLGLRQRDVEVVSGVRSRQKRVKVGLASLDDLARRLGVGTHDEPPRRERHGGG